MRVLLANQIKNTARNEGFGDGKGKQELDVLSEKKGTAKKS